MLSAFFNRFYREILIIVNIFAIYNWKYLFTEPDPKWWQVVLFILTACVEGFSFIFCTSVKIWCEQNEYIERRFIYNYCLDSL